MTPVGAMAGAAVVLILTALAPAQAHDVFADQEISVSDGVVVVHRPFAKVAAPDAIGLAKPKVVILRSGETVAVRRGARIAMPEPVILVPVTRIPVTRHDGAVGVASGFRSRAVVVPVVPLRPSIHKRSFGRGKIH